jgi:GxxExxY protein
MIKSEVIHRRGTELAEFAQSELTGRILKAAFEVHTVLGPGLLESAYQGAMIHELQLQGLSFASQVSVPLQYKGTVLSSPLRLDLLVESLVIVEIKSILTLEDIHHAQLLTYLRLTNLQAGLLINFNVVSLKLGIKRVINTPRNSANSVPLR